MKISIDDELPKYKKLIIDIKYYNDSRLLHHIKLKLIAQGFDVIKKEAWKDGHLVSEGLYYIRDRKKDGISTIWTIKSEMPMKISIEEN